MEYINEINKATLHLAEKNRLESLERFVKKDSKCEGEKKINSVNLSKLKTFFICAFGCCAILLIHMVVNPQNRLVNNNETLASSVNSGGNSDEVV